MNPYPERLTELHRFLEAQFGHKDRMATEILLTALLPTIVTGHRRPWIIIETDWPSRDCQSAWFSFGLTDCRLDGATNILTTAGNADRLAVRSLSTPRVQRSARCEEILQEWLALRRTDAPGLFVEAEWRRLPTAGRGATLLMATHSYSVLLSQCIRLRVDHPRGGYATLTRDEQTAVTNELRRLASRVLDCSHRALTRPMTINSQLDKQIGKLRYWLELLQRLAPLQTDWDALIGSVSACATGRDALYGEQTERRLDGGTAERLMRDMIPYATRTILEQTALGRARGIKAFQLFKQSGQVADRAITHEIRRLARERVLTARQNYRAAAAASAHDPYGYHPWRYTFGDGDYGRLLRRDERLLE